MHKRTKREPKMQRSPGARAARPRGADLTSMRRRQKGANGTEGEEKSWRENSLGLREGALLDWSKKGVFFDPAPSGKLAGTFAHHELAAEADLLPRVRLWHYRSPCIFKTTQFVDVACDELLHVEKLHALADFRILG